MSLSMFPIRQFCNKWQPFCAYTTPVITRSDENLYTLHRRSYKYGKLMISNEGITCNVKQSITKWEQKKPICLACASISAWCNDWCDMIVRLTVNCTGNCTMRKGLFVIASHVSHPCIPHRGFCLINKDVAFRTIMTPHTMKIAHISYHCWRCFIYLLLGYCCKI